MNALAILEVARCKLVLGGYFLPDRPSARLRRDMLPGVKRLQCDDRVVGLVDLLDE